MKLDKLIAERFKEKPSDCHIDSHALMVRGGYIKQVANGIYSSYMIMRRITRKIEQIIREEMDAIDGQEVQLPVAMPASLWQESGRYESVGKELLRFSDRNDSPMLLGMTHEEAAVHLAREHGVTYAKYPFMLYQIQTKFRDEMRPRGGLIRVREFTMKDAYSFHVSQEDLESYYERCRIAYERIFARAGIPEVVCVASDSGMMGGNVSHEFMLLTPVGEDSIVVCSECSYRSNMEIAESIVVNREVPEVSIEKVHTPDQKTIDDVCHFLKLPVEQSCKAVVYQMVEDMSFVVVFIRGDLEINETKVRNYLKGEIIPAVLDIESEIVAGFIGPLGLKNARAIFDRSLEGQNNLCCGANELDYHLAGFSMKRDCPTAVFHDFAKAADGGICPCCQNPSLRISRGIEVGNIFQLGQKYTKPMDMLFTDENGESHHAIMGCYGIGVGRLAASVCEVSHDENGPIWPMSIAPWQVHICCLRADDAALRACSDQLYADLLREKIEVVYDDRSVSAGVMFSDADLLGVPVRVIISPRNMAEGCCEIATRDKSFRTKVPMEKAVEEIQSLIEKITAEAAL